MPIPLAGIHHVTAVVDDVQQNLDFYSQVLGLRLVKRTVNFDDPYTYHFYFGDASGTPGTLVTFFPWPNGQHGSHGTGEISAFSFVVPPGALDYWAHRLDSFALRRGEPVLRLGEQVMPFYDPSGLLVELVERPDQGQWMPWAGSTVPNTVAVRGLAGVLLTLNALEPTAALLTGLLGFSAGQRTEQRARFLAHDGACVDIALRPELQAGRGEAGSIHHVAWRVADAAAQLEWREQLLAAGLEVTPVRDRRYFQSLYFREPGGVLFELATDGPGFASDELPDALGSSLILPPWLEQMRANIERHLPPATFPN